MVRLQVTSPNYAVVLTPATFLATSALLYQATSLASLGQWGRTLLVASDEKTRRKKRSMSKKLQQGRAPCLAELSRQEGSEFQEWLDPGVCQLCFPPDWLHSEAGCPVVDQLQGPGWGSLPCSGAGGARRKEVATH